MLSNLNKKIFIIIPALNPDENVIKYVEELINNNFKNILVINDGSTKDREEIFERLSKMKECYVITHSKNEGKGKAIKDGLKFFLEQNDISEYAGVITVDCDGQHLVKDIVSISEEMRAKQDSLFLGVRDFSKDNVPPKSSFGNKITSKVLKILYGKQISDTQTGLRGISTNLVNEFANLPGNRYEYETNMLIEAILKKVNIIEIPIETVYIDNNSNSHFRPIIDSISIYYRILNTFFKYVIVSVISFIVDILLFNIFIKILGVFFTNSLILVSTVLARIVSSFVNFVLNKKFSFRSRKKFSNAIFKYYVLCIVQMLISGIAVTILYNILGISEVTIKIIVDTILFFVNYKIQKKWIF